MLNNAMEETKNMLAAQARLFINIEIAMERYYCGGNGLAWYDISYALSDACDVRRAMCSREDRFIAWRESVAAQKNRARSRLHARLQHEDQNTRPYNPIALGHLLRSMKDRIPCRRPFASLAEAVRATIKSDRAGQRAGKQRLIELAYNCNYQLLVYEVMGKRWPVLRAAVGTAQRRFEVGHWKRPVWAGGGFIDRYPSHFVHAAHEMPGNVAFYADTDKLEADKLTSMKPGRYLSAFYGDDLSAEEIKQWANKQQALMTPTELKFVGNDDPLGWMWVYENSSPSCMRYNRNNRYIDLGLKGAYHPVTVYAHPENNLALAYIMLPGNAEDRTMYCLPDAHVVGARAIVNTRNKTYLRLYAAGDVQYTAMEKAFDSAGYTQSDDTLRHEKLRLEKINGGYLCPYLDGDYARVQVRSSHLLVSEYGISARETIGYVREDEDEPHYYCSHCDTYHDEEDVAYVGSVGEWVCDDCTERDFVWAEGRHGARGLHRNDSDDIVYCTYDGRYYETEHLSDNNMGMTENGEVYPDEQLVETEHGTYHMCDVVELTYAFNDYVWTPRDKTYHLPNGETCHVDDEDKIAEIEALEQEAA